MNIAEMTDERQVLSEIARSEEDTGVLDDAEEEVEIDNDGQTTYETYEITSYGADFDVDGLVRRLKKGDIFVPRFQRSFVWTQVDASRFVESLLLGFPVPSIFLSKESTNKLLIVDGQQRLLSLLRYYEGSFGDRKFRLLNLKSSYNGKAYDELSPDDKRKLDDSLIHAIIVQEAEPAEHHDVPSSIYLLFERLNSWGRPLFPQEIRACVEHGDFIDLLHELNDLKDWREMYGPKSKRLKDEELILRFIALYYDESSYKSRQTMKTFLNGFCSANRDLKKHSAEEFRKRFTDVIVFAKEMLGKDAFRPTRAFNAAFFDAVSVGLAKRLSTTSVQDTTAIKKAYQKLLEDRKFHAAYSQRTSDEEQVRNRLQIAKEAFATII